MSAFEGTSAVLAGTSSRHLVSAVHVLAVDGSLVAIGGHAVVAQHRGDPKPVVAKDASTAGGLRRPMLRMISPSCHRLLVAPACQSARDLHP